MTGTNGNPTAIGVTGCTGRMGRMLLAEIAGTEGCMLAGGTEAPGSRFAGQDLGEFVPGGHGPIGTDAAALFATAQAVIDFTTPAATAAHADLAAKHGRVLVVGTTGLGPSEEAALRAAATKVPVVWAANMSLGVTLLGALVREAASKLGIEYDIEIVEMHHRAKVDAPSGTALALGRAAALGRGVDLDAVSQRVRDGHTGARNPGDIGFATLRGGDVVGDHMVIFAGPGERLEIGHRASNRQIFARGAVRAALWAVGQPPGLYDMKDVLGLSS